jgi:hypothetical protein
MLCARMHRFLICALLLLPVACISIHEPTGRIEPLPATASADLGCTPLLLAVYGHEDAEGNVVGGGSGVAVHERVILTAGHVIPSEARFLYARVAGTEGSADRGSPVWRGQGARIRKIVKGGGAATSEGDWALIILDRPLSRIGVRPASNLLAQGARAPLSGVPVVIAGFPFEAGDDATSREPVIVRTTIASAPPGARASDAFLFADYAAGRTDLSGLSGGPVFMPLGAGAAPVLVGIHIASGISKFADVTTSRTILIRRTPTDEIVRAIADLPPVPARPERHGP